MPTVGCAMDLTAANAHLGMEADFASSVSKSCALSNKISNRLRFYCKKGLGKRHFAVCTAVCENA